MKKCLTLGSASISGKEFITLTKRKCSLESSAIPWIEALRRTLNAILLEISTD